MAGFEPGSGACGTKSFTTAPEGHCLLVGEVNFIVRFASSLHVVIYKRDSLCDRLEGGIREAFVVAGCVWGRMGGD